MGWLRCGDFLKPQGGTRLNYLEGEGVQEKGDGWTSGEFGSFELRRRREPEKSQFP